MDVYKELKMRKSKEYTNTKFTVETIKRAIELFDKNVKDRILEKLKDQKKSHSIFPGNELSIDKLFASNLSVSESIALGGTKWTFDSEDEFFAEYRNYEMDNNNLFEYTRYGFGLSISIRGSYGFNTTVEISVFGFPNNRSRIEKIFDIFEADAPSAKLPITPSKKPKIFIGHGRSKVWRDLKDHLQDKHGHEVVAYEVGARAGHTIRDILEDMLTNSSFAVLVMTGEDETAEGKYRARQNVIHETGLFQGKLGFNRAIVLLEEGTEVFSNIQGIEQIRFSKGNIKETYGDILATIKREFY